MITEFTTAGYQAISGDKTPLFIEIAHLSQTHNTVCVNPFHERRRQLLESLRENECRLKKNINRIKIGLWSAHGSILWNSFGSL